MANINVILDFPRKFKDRKLERKQQNKRLKQTQLFIVYMADVITTAGPLVPPWDIISTDMQHVHHNYVGHYFTSSQGILCMRPTNFIKAAIP